VVKKLIDSTDLKILRILQDEGRISNLDLAKKINMSPPPTLRRVRDLEQGGFIDEYRANINATKLGFDLTVWIFVSLKNQNEESLRQFEKLVWGWEQVRECYMLNGEVDFILKCVSKNMEDFNNFLTNQVTSYENISSVKTAFAIKNTKSLGKVPLD
jgi:DNA-binding Lrp family transcriptional regulator